MKIYTIGYTKKTAEEFFELLKKNGIERLIDIRLKNSSQLSGFTKKEDLSYFLKLFDIEYQHMPLLAPTEDMLKNYKKEKDWNEYEKSFINLLSKRNLNKFKNNFIEKKTVLLCSEETADKCHRRLVAEYIKKEFFSEIEIIHL